MKKDKFVLGLIVLGTVLFGFNCAKAVAPTADSATAGPELTTGSPQTSEEMNNFLQSIASNDLGLSDKPFLKGQAKEVLPFYSNPFTKFNLSLSAPEEKKDENNTNKKVEKDSIDLNGTLSFRSDSQLENENFILQCQEKYGKNDRCLKSETYNMTEFKNLDLWVQVWRKDGNKETGLNGDYLVDEFYATTPFDLAQGETKTFKTSWKIPAGAREGDYYMAFYINSNKKFDLWGTPLTVFSFAQTYDFSVLASTEKDQTGGVEIDKNNIEINKILYAYRKPAPTIKINQGSNVIIEAPLVNLSSQEEKTSVTYQLTAWGQTDPEKVITKKEETQVFASGQKKQASFTFTPSDNESVYNLKIIVKGAKSQSISNVRFVIDGQNKGIFRFLGFAQKENSNVTNPLFCLRNASWKGNFEGKIALTLLGKDGQEKGSWSGDINLAPETRCFVPDGLSVDNKTCVQLTGEIFDKNGKLTQKEETTFACKSDDAALSGNTVSNNYGQEISKVSLIAKLFLVTLILIIGIIVVVIYSKYLNNKHNQK